MSWFNRRIAYGTQLVGTVASRTIVRTLLSIAGLGLLILSPQPAQLFADSRKDDSRKSESRKGGSHDNEEENDRDGVILTFSTVGDSRQDPKSPHPTSLPLSAQDKIWLQNTKAWTRIIRSIQKQESDFLFFNGDMIMGYGKASLPADNKTINGIVSSDLMQFYRQYGFWRGLVAGLMETGTYVVPVPGNHETQCSDKVSTQCGIAGKHAMAENEAAWRANMGELILDDGRFSTLFGEQPAFENTGDNGALDNLSTDQSKLSYSFDFRGSHFVVINTDPVGNDAHAPSNWLAVDLAAAAERGARSIFVFGHKPAFTYYYGESPVLPSSPSGLDQPGLIAARDAFWTVIEQYGATYFCGHEHIFNLSQPTAAKGGKAWQVLGGSPFEAAPTDLTINPDTDRHYAWATVKIYKSGLVKITAYGFDDLFGQTRVLGSIKLWP